MKKKNGIIIFKKTKRYIFCVMSEVCKDDGIWNYIT